MKKKLLLSAMLAFCLLATFFLASCDYTGDSDSSRNVGKNEITQNPNPTSPYQPNGQTVTVSQLSGLPHKSYVLLQGNIVNQVWGEYYTFRDSTGEVIVEIERKVLRVTPMPGPSERVELYAKVEWEWDKRNGGAYLEVEVKSIRRI